MPTAVLPIVTTCSGVVEGGWGRGARKLGRRLVVRVKGNYSDFSHGDPKVIGRLIDGIWKSRLERLTMTQRQKDPLWPLQAVQWAQNKVQQTAQPLMS